MNGHEQLRLRDKIYTLMYPYFREVGGDSVKSKTKCSEAAEVIINFVWLYTRLSTQTESDRSTDTEQSMKDIVLTEGEVKKEQ